MALHSCYHFTGEHTRIDLLLETLTWTKINAGGQAPSPRYHHTTVVFKESIYVFGGSDGTNKLGDFFEYKISRWLLVLLVTCKENNAWFPVAATPSPSARDGQVAVQFQNSMYVCGGGESGPFEIFEFDFGELGTGYGCWQEQISGSGSKCTWLAIPLLQRNMRFLLWEGIVYSFLEVLEKDRMNWITYALVRMNLKKSWN